MLFRSLVQVLSVVPGEEEESREKIDLICQNFQQSQAGTEIRADIKALESQTSDEDQILDQTQYQVDQVLDLNLDQAGSGSGPGYGYFSFVPLSS